MKSLVRENRTQGSARGAPRKGRSYRDAHESEVTRRKEAQRAVEKTD